MKPETKQEIREFLIDNINEFRADAERFGFLTITIGYTPEDGEWGWQTGDNSYTGGAYGHPIWGVIEINENTIMRDITEIIFGQIEDMEQHLDHSTLPMENV